VALFQEVVGLLHATVDNVRDVLRTPDGAVKKRVIRGKIVVHSASLLFAGQHKNQYGGPGFFLVAAGFRSGGDSPLTTNAKLYCWFSANVNGPTVSDKALFGLASMEDFGHSRRRGRLLRSSACSSASTSPGRFCFSGYSGSIWRIERLAGLLFVPYAAWVTYATILNASLWLLNKT
jgi:hypothetical protein